MKNTLVIGLCLLSSAAFAAPSQIESFTKTAPDIGRLNPTTKMKVRVWLNLRNPDGLTQLANAVIDPRSPQYEHWLTKEQLQSRFLPVAADAAKVSGYLVSRGLSIVAVAPNNHWVKAEGTAATIEKAFGVELHEFQVDEKRVYATVRDPEFPQSIAPLVAEVGGLTNRGAKFLHFPHRHPRAGKVGAKGIDLGHYTIDCFKAPETHQFTSADGTITATYTGWRFVADPDPADATSMSSCGYDPATIQKAYGLDRLYARGLDGRGETIILNETYGSPTLQADLDAYDQLYSLPPAQLQIVTPDGPPVVGPWNADAQSWAQEVTMDVESAHVVAPGATLLIVAEDGNADDTAGLAYAVENHLGNSISNSWVENGESLVPPATLALYESILKSAVVQGISVQFSSGDGGDLGRYSYTDIFYPPTSTYVTAVGGTSLAVNPDGSRGFELGWGTNEMQVSNGPTLPLDPPVESNPFWDSGFLVGAGGGASRTFAKPKFQHHLRGTQRLVPDIAYLADGYTGLRVLESAFDPSGNPEPGVQSIEIMAGTSLSAPMFSAMWAIANQNNGESLGLASAKIYRLPEGAINDILPADQALAAANVTGSITDGSGTTAQSALSLSFPETSASFLSTLFLTPLYESSTGPNWYVLTFGTDSSLAVAPGWDPVTGLGTPNGEAFVDALAGL